MDEVNVDRTKLLQILMKNRDSHRAIFERAIEGYRQKVIQHLDYALECARRGEKMITALILSKPIDHTPDYDRAIGMLEMSVDENVVIDNGEYRMYVLDEWNWSRQFSESSRSSTSSSSLSSLQKTYSLSE